MVLAVDEHVCHLMTQTFPPLSVHRVQKRLHAADPSVVSVYEVVKAGEVITVQSARPHSLTTRTKRLKLRDDIGSGRVGNAFKGLLMHLKGC